MDSPRSKYAFIGDNFHNIEEVTVALRETGLESSNLIIGIDFTKSNEWMGKRSFNGKSLHSISRTALNPYEQAIEIIGKTLSTFDDDNLIPCYGFGDVHTSDRAVFSFYPNDRCCEGFEGVLARYREIIPHVRLAGPTSFAPVIKAAIDVVDRSGGKYHVLLIIADGQVTQGIIRGTLSSQEQATIDAIVEASDYPLSIVLVGVGDGPWDTMREFDDKIPKRVFDNFQFVNFTEIMLMNKDSLQKEAMFALRALMEVPLQYKATLELGLLNRTLGKPYKGIVKPPPPGVPAHDIPSIDLSVPETSKVMYPTDNLSCPICFTEPKDMAFGCGHQVCRRCAVNLENCPLCRQPITTRLRLYL